MIGSDSVGVQAGVQEQKFFKNPCKYWPFQGGVGYPRLHLDGGSTTSISTDIIVKNAREPCVLGLFLCCESRVRLNNASGSRSLKGLKSLGVRGGVYTSPGSTLYASKALINKVL